MFETHGREPVATFCDPCCNGCPQVFVDHGASVERRVVVTDDFGAQICMSAGQFAAMVAQAKSGALDALG